MPILPGRRLGPFEILSAIGAGGMGEICQAHDNKLGRDVAIKVLSESFVNYHERLSRFERQARVLALLIHPDAATNRELEYSDRFHSLIMEWICGRAS